MNDGVAILFLIFPSPITEYYPDYPLAFPKSTLEIPWMAFYRNSDSE